VSHEPTASAPSARPPWYEGISRYQWLVLVIASLGWVFDVFEGQVFVATEKEAMPALLGQGEVHQASFYTNVALAAFLTGGALGGVLFGMLGDRIGRKRTLSLTILCYAIFTGLSAFATSWWQMALFRFLVAMGVGGEWAVASTFVAEVFPPRARPWSQSIFHASSVLGSFLAVAAGVFIVANPDLRFSISLFGSNWQMTGWRLAFLLGVVPAILILWVRVSLREPETWLQARANTARNPESRPGRMPDLFAGDLLRRTLVGMGLATVAMATFWGTHIFGKDLMRDHYAAPYLATLSPGATAQEREAVLKANVSGIKPGEMLGMFLVTAGGGLGLLCFGSLSERLGRRGAFLFYLLGGLVSTLLLFQAVRGMTALCLMLPVFGFLTLGMHAGCSVYFPELFPTRLRGTGAGFCFNVGRLVAAPILIVKGFLVKDGGFTPNETASLLSVLFLVGVLILPYAPETRGKGLPEDSPSPESDGLKEIERS
jgi:MFS family permease